MYIWGMPGRSVLADDLLRSAARLSRWASRQATFEVTSAQARLLALLDELGPARVSLLAEADHSSQPSMTTALQRLEAQGWARRGPDPDDARASLLSLTAAGHEALRGVRDARARALAPALDSLSPEDVDRLRDAVAAMHSLLQHAATPAPSRKDS